LYSQLRWRQRSSSFLSVPPLFVHSFIYLSLHVATGSFYIVRRFRTYFTVLYPYTRLPQYILISECMGMYIIATFLRSFLGLQLPSCRFHSDAESFGRYTLYTNPHDSEHSNQPQARQQYMCWSRIGESALHVGYTPPNPSPPDNERPTKISAKLSDQFLSLAQSQLPVLKVRYLIILTVMMKI